MWIDAMTRSPYAPEVRRDVMGAGTTHGLPTLTLDEFDRILGIFHGAMRRGTPFPLVPGPEVRYTDLVREAELRPPASAGSVAAQSPRLSTPRRDMKGKQPAQPSPRPDSASGLSIRGAAARAGRTARAKAPSRPPPRTTPQDQISLAPPSDSRAIAWQELAAQGAQGLVGENVAPATAPSPRPAAVPAPRPATDTKEPVAKGPAAPPSKPSEIWPLARVDGSLAGFKLTVGGEPAHQVERTENQRELALRRRRDAINQWQKLRETGAPAGKVAEIEQEIKEHSGQYNYLTEELKRLMDDWFETADAIHYEVAHRATYETVLTPAAPDSDEYQRWRYQYTAGPPMLHTHKQERTHSQKAAKQGKGPRSVSSQSEEGRH
ncbi:hypothetical protein KEM52_004106 [Ascosphaera acerosa]|nr:hypothetical protein KEM52_004106 [Ascosphaera acerosa]